MDRFSKLHPLMQFLFFTVSFAVVLTMSNPVISAVSLLCSIAYGTRLRGREIIKSIWLSLGAILFVGIFNMLFAHYGADTLFKIKDTAFTLEALFYGVNQGMVLSAVVVWFSILSRVFDSERVIYLFRFAPKTALLFSMVLGFIPRFTKKLDDIRDAQLGLHSGKRAEKTKDKIKTALDNISVLITYSLESSIITADSMQARGYNPRAVRAGRFRITKFDIVLIILIICLLAVVIIKKSVFVFEPKIYFESFDLLGVLCFAILELLPIAVDFTEDVLWRLSSVKN